MFYFVFFLEHFSDDREDTMPWLTEEPMMGLAGFEGGIFLHFLH